MPRPWGSPDVKKSEDEPKDLDNRVAIAVLVTMVGGIAPAESWRFDIQLPGVMVALLLMSVTGPFALLFGQVEEFL